MTTYLVHRSDQVGSAAQAARSFLESRPVEHNLILTLLRERIARPEPGRYWWITENGVVRGVAMQSPLTFRSTVTPVPLDAIAPLVDAMAADAPGLPGVSGEAATVATFAGAWTERGGSAAPIEGQRLYRLDEVVAPTGVPGALRRAATDDLDHVVEWFEAFHVEIDSPFARADAGAIAAARVADGQVWLWQHDGTAVSSAMITTPIAGAARIGFVYTPPASRGHGFAAATVAALCSQALDGASPFGRVDTCLLYTQLHNATSNRVYRRIGFRSVAEVLAYAFDER